MIESGEVVTDCFKKGYLASGFHQLRQTQECALKLLAFVREPSLAMKKKVEQKDVQRVLNRDNFPSWGKYYGELCKISHLDRDFALKMYPALWVGKPVDEGIVRLMEMYLMWLNVFTDMTLWAVLNQLKSPMGGDFQQLEPSYLVLHARMEADYKVVMKKVDAAKRENKLGLLV